MRLKSHDRVLLANSNVTEHGHDKYSVMNTCAFNSVAFALAAMYYDSHSYRAYLEKSDNELFKFVIGLALNGPTRAVYNKRTELLKKHFETNKLYQDVYVIDAQCNVSKIVMCYLKNEPSVTETFSCTLGFGCPEKTRTSSVIVLQTENENCKISMLQSLLDAYLATSEHLCQTCWKPNKSFKKCHKHIFIETDQFPPVPLGDVPRILNKT